MNPAWSHNVVLTPHVAVELAFTMFPLVAFGWFAAGLTLLTLACSDARSLRTVAILANLAFIAHGLAFSVLPVLALHAVMLLVNTSRLVAAWRQRADAKPAEPGLAVRQSQPSSVRAVVSSKGTPQGWKASRCPFRRPDRPRAHATGYSRRPTTSYGSWRAPGCVMAEATSASHPTALR